MKKRNLALLALTLLVATAPRVEAQVWTTFEAAPRRAWFGFEFDRRTLEVTNVVEASPAQKAGLRVDDVILRINGLSAGDQLIGSLGSSLEAGDTVVFRVRRGTREQDLRIIAAKPPASFERRVEAFGPGGRISFDSINGLMRVFVDSARAGMDTTFWRVLPGGDSAMIRILTNDDSIVWRGDSTRFHMLPRWGGRDSMLFSVRPGVEVFRELRGDRPTIFMDSWGIGMSAIAGARLQELNPDLARYFKVESGVLVLEVPEDTPARAAGLRAGDVITHAGGGVVTGIDQLRRAIREVRGNTVALDVVRDGQKRSLQLKK